MTRILVLLALLLPGAALAQAPATAIPEPMRGNWTDGDCARPAAVLHVTPRAAVRLPAEGAGRLLRFAAIARHEDWVLGTADGAAAPRLLLRMRGDALETVEPEAKTRDDALPGPAALQLWRRCPQWPPALVAQHGEGIAFLGMLERVEAACGEGMGAAGCLAALYRAADISGDGLLSAAELARLFRGAAWIAAVEEPADERPALQGLTAAAALLLARGVVESLDYDGDGRLSLAELAQDRGGLPESGGTAEGHPLPLIGLTEALGALRAVVSGAAAP
ncbi:EF-hand domain-containing protein [Plastoroseomonas hellenica]|uniref:EF-hand domain-containing protein n=1 Tax=Plastoroseomonas hellenica TaxID=2687306 RepID=A0ABS5F9Y1_9PROT|nr:EF-hand domain-containing protein [Plastoroseomonas hellenica]MBR0646229.1 EF-hand domain-containing protein [Plastoroseomonas hellenica]MBR0669263.1 EF-hand domain-containing protein [Plastoroseomonas hellenica]